MWKYRRRRDDEAPVVRPIFSAKPMGEGQVLRVICLLLIDLLSDRERTPPVPRIFGEYPNERQDIVICVERIREREFSTEYLLVEDIRYFADHPRRGNRLN